MMPAMVRVAPLVMAMSTAWVVRLLPMMAVMIATGIMMFAFWYEWSPCPYLGRGSD